MTEERTEVPPSRLPDVDPPRGPDRRVRPGSNVGRRWLMATIGLGVMAPLIVKGLDIFGPQDARRRKAMSYPYPLIDVPASDALATWQDMKSQPGSPVVLGDAEEVAMLLENMSNNLPGLGSTEAILAKAAGFVFPDDLRTRRRDEEAAAWKILSEDPQARAFVQALSGIGATVGGAPDLGTWPSEPFESPVLSFPDKYEVISGKVVSRKVDRVAIATFPTDDWTEVFAYARFGGWNACPWPHEHVAAFRHWTARYRLELVSMSHDTLYLRAGHRPETREDALALAREQYDYCPDIVDEGLSLNELAAGLMANDWWFFWWD